ncbi:MULTISPECIES: hypothetical protein [unclassified Streptomyces]|uniref:hypothetical protein n=1 Tax=unclassified Streptomyces TaxID=2593676 RepID=UPI0006B005D3|nr:MULTISPECIES: hypothetical protein [unclassified Streptomyces]KOX35441.1 hypothetical protein ADL06_06625 [Streptomyces sp. NRRL F-6491]KOX50555.1 hypothetical protein ADL08_06145 [Streptomyces sp. NRRL F-6492]
MRLTADGTTPVVRSVLVDEPRTGDGCAFEPVAPFFLWAGDRVAFEDGGVVVVRVSGERVVCAGSWSTRCRPGSGWSPRVS